MMNDDLQDDDDLDLDDTGFDDFDDGTSDDESTLARLWRESPMFKVGVIVGGIVIVLVIFSMLGGEEEVTAPSRVTRASDVSSTPGEEGSSQAYIESIVDSNAERFEEAYTTGGSAIPTPIEAPSGVLSLPDAEGEEDDDPLQRWRDLQEQRLSIASEPPPPVAPDPAESEARQQAIQSMADLMAQQMQAILDEHGEYEVQTIGITEPEYLEDLFPEEEIVDENGDGIPDSDQEETPAEILLPAGQIVYAQLITEANSDVAGPVLAEIVSGKLKGSRILGEFSVNENSDLLTLNFNSIVIEDITYSISAVALDPATTLPGMATDVDHHYLRRIVLPAAAAFVEGMTTAIAESGTTTITVSGEVVTEAEEDASNDQEVASGVAEAGAEIASIIDEMNENTEPTIIIHSGTPMGLLFTAPVVLDDDDSEVDIDR